MTRLIETHLQACAAATIAVEEVPAADVVHYGIVEPKHEVGPVFPIADLIEKPSVEPPRAATRLPPATCSTADLRDAAAHRAGHGGEIS